ncbi:MAG: response regulator transcription factor [Paracoccaceae bacterium]|nr:response regulator transcription factor [Paracoccaceae bacterium]
MKILVADDDPEIRTVLTVALERAGFGVVSAADGQAALREARRAGPALVVLDVGLPELDGLEVCRRLRAASAVPILFLTARDDEIDRVLGLELGADDYMTKPFSPRELTARIKAILRRAGPGGPPPQPLRRGVLTLDPEQHACTVAEAPVALTAMEMALLARLMRHPDRIGTRPELSDALYGNAEVSDRTLDSHLRNLRRKLAEAGCPDAIETLHGIGLRMGACRGA